MTRLATASRFALGDRLRLCARRARGSNPYVNLPLKAPAAWTTGQVVTIGAVRSNANKLYVANSAGTCGATGPTHTTNVQVTDGAVFWIYLGPAFPLSDDANGPAVTFSTSNPALGRLIRPVTFPGLFKANGGNPLANRTDHWQLAALNSSAATPFKAKGSVSFETNALRFAPVLDANGGPVRVIIDGHYVSMDGYNPGGSDSFALFDFTTTGARRNRRVTLEFSSSANAFGGLQVATTDDVRAPSGVDDPRVVWITDSIGAGSSFHNLIPGNDFPNNWGHLLGLSDVWNMSTGGTGYIATNGGTAYNFGQRIADATNGAVIATADLVCLMGSTNDIGQSSGTITVAATSAIQAIRALNPACAIIVFGVLPINNVGVATVETAVAAGVTAAADARTFFVPLFGASPLPMVTGAWNNSADATSLTANLIISNGDNVHPTEMGARTIAEFLARETERQVYRLI